MSFKWAFFKKWKRYPLLYVVPKSVPGGPTFMPHTRFPDSSKETNTLCKRRSRM